MFQRARLQLDEGSRFTFFILKWADNGDLIDALGPFRSEASAREAAEHMISESKGRYRWHAHKWLGDARS
jgi:hypothetical protein